MKTETGPERSRDEEQDATGSSAALSLRMESSVTNENYFTPLPFFSFFFLFLL